MAICRRLSVALIVSVMWCSWNDVVDTRRSVVVWWWCSWDDVVDTRRSAVSAAVSVLRGIPDEQRLLMKIQRNYDSRVRPVYNSTHRVVVKFALTLVQIVDMVSDSIHTRLFLAA